MTFEALFAARPWQPIRHCPGRFVLAPSDETPAQLLGLAEAPLEYPLPVARDPVSVAAFPGGGLISYRHPDGRYVHTLNTAEGFARKLQQLGLDPR
jgi:hypothetical protein